MVTNEDSSTIILKNLYDYSCLDGIIKNKEKELKEIYFWKKTFDVIMKYVKKKYPELYHYIILRFIQKKDRKQIKKLLNMSFENQEKLDKKLFRLIDKYLYKKGLAV